MINQLPTSIQGKRRLGIREGQTQYKKLTLKLKVRPGETRQGTLILHGMSFHFVIPRESKEPRCTVFFPFFCRDAGLHLGAGYRSDPAGGRAVSCLFYLHVLHDLCIEKVLWMSAALLVYF